MLEMAMALIGLLLLVGAILWAGGGKTLHTAHGSGIIETIAGAVETAPPPVDELVILSYAMAYGLEEAPWTSSRPTATDVYDRLDAIIETIAASDADIVLLQEADFASHRTYDVDQLQYIAVALGWGFIARAITWECRYLPSPWWQPWRHAGRLRAGQGIISRYPLVQNTRQRLPQSARQPLFSPLFAPYHTVQMVDVQCGTRTVRLLHAHLEPYEAATRQRQVQELLTFVRQAATPNCVLMGAWGSPMATSRPDEAMDLLRTGLRDRLRLVAATEPGTTAVGSYVLIGPGLQTTATHIVQHDMLRTALPPVAVRLRWALPLTTSHGSTSHAHC
jgi:endonuclease/exonuclease/phosphatase family metal-dependent hydrolase